MSNLAPIVLTEEQAIVAAAERLAQVEAENLALRTALRSLIAIGFDTVTHPTGLESCRLCAASLDFEPHRVDCLVPVVCTLLGEPESPPPTE